MYLVSQNSLCLYIYRSCNSALLSVLVSVCDLCERDRLKERETGSICLHVLITAISDQLHAYPVCRDLFTAALRPERTSVLLHFPRKFQGLDSRFECVCSGCKSLHCANRYWHILNYSLAMMSTDILKTHTGISLLNITVKESW